MANESMDQRSGLHSRSLGTKSFALQDHWHQPKAFSLSKLSQLSAKIPKGGRKCVQGHLDLSVQSHYFLLNCVIAPTFLECLLCGWHSTKPSRELHNMVTARKEFTFPSPSTVQRDVSVVISKCHQAPPIFQCITQNSIILGVQMYLWLVPL